MNNLEILQILSHLRRHMVSVYPSIMSNPQFGDDRLRGLLELLQENELTVEEIRCIYNEIVYLQFVCSNFCIEIPQEAR